eukprot:m51a1_g4139 hypothetical protein (1230) ;mRNA; r:210106-214910
MTARVSLTLGKCELYVDSDEVIVQTIVHAKERTLGFSRRFKSDTFVILEKKDGKHVGWLRENTIADLPLTASLSFQMWKKSTFYQTKIGSVHIRVPEVFLKPAGEDLMPVICSKTGSIVGYVAATIEVAVETDVLTWIADEVKSGADWIYAEAKEEPRPSIASGFFGRLRAAAAPAVLLPYSSAVTAPRKAKRPQQEDQSAEACPKAGIEELLGQLKASWEMRPSDLQRVAEFVAASPEQFAEMQGVNTLLDVLGYYCYKAESSQRAELCDSVLIKGVVDVLEPLLAASSVVESLVRDANTNFAYLVRALPFLPRERVHLIFNWLFVFLTTVDALCGSEDDYKKEFTVALLNELTLKVHGLLDDIISSGTEISRLSCLHFIYTLIECQGNQESRSAVREHFVHNGVDLIKLEEIIPPNTSAEVLAIVKKIIESATKDMSSSEIETQILELFRAVMVKAQAAMAMDDLHTFLRSMSQTPEFSTKMHDVNRHLSVRRPSRPSSSCVRRAKVAVNSESTQTDFEGDLGSALTGTAGLPSSNPEAGHPSRKTVLDKKGICPLCGSSPGARKPEASEPNENLDSADDDNKRPRKVVEDIPPSFLRVVDDVLGIRPQVEEVAPEGATGAPPPLPPLPPPPPMLGMPPPLPKKALAKSKVVPIKVERLTPDEARRTVYADADADVAAVDGEALRELFTQRSAGPAQAKEKRVEIVYCLAQQRRQNVDMFLRKNKIETTALRDALLDPPACTRAEDAEMFERLADLMCSRASKGDGGDADAEERRMREFEPKSAFSRPERFLYELYQIPRVRQKLEGIAMRAVAMGLFETADSDAAAVVDALEMLSAPAFRKAVGYLVRIIVSTRLQRPTEECRTLGEWLVGVWRQSEPDIVPYAREVGERVGAAVESLKRLEMVFPQALECLYKSARTAAACTDASEQRYRAAMCAFADSVEQRLLACVCRLAEIDGHVRSLGDSRAEPPETAQLRKAIEQAWAHVPVPESKRQHLAARVQRDHLRLALLLSVQQFAAIVRAVDDKLALRERDQLLREARVTLRKAPKGRAHAGEPRRSAREDLLAEICGHKFPSTPEPRAREEEEPEAPSAGATTPGNVTRAEAVAIVVASALKDPNNKAAAQAAAAIIEQASSAVKSAAAVSRLSTPARRRSGALGLLDAGSPMKRTPRSGPVTPADVVKEVVSADGNDERFERLARLGEINCITPLRPQARSRISGASTALEV